jgi:phosphate transport system substrate-binding protein
LPGKDAPGAVEQAVRSPVKDAPGAVEQAVRPPAAGAPAGSAVRAPPGGAGAPVSGARVPAADASSRFPLGASLGVLVFVLMAAFAFWLAQGGGPPRQPERATVAPAPPVQPAPAAAAAQPAPAAAGVQPASAAAAVQVILRLAGSNTAGAQLAPALAQGYLASLGATGVESSSAGPDEVSVQGTKDGARQAIIISAHGSATAFEALLAGNADVGMASRRVKPEEAQRLAALGSMTSPANEHVVALDGIAVIVSKANPIAQLSREQLAAVFGGRVSNWSQLKGLAGPIHLYAPDDRSGTADLFQALVLGKAPLSPGAKRLSTNQAVADAVVGDPRGIGLVGLPFVRGAKALAVAEGDAAPMIPNAFTLANEDYFLARRLYLYTDQASKNPHVSPFVEFALGPEGQAIVRKAGFVELTVKAEPRPPPDGAPAGYVRLTAGSRRLSTDFRFVAGSSRLDNRAMRDLERVVEFLRDNDLNGASVRLLGFADSHGGAAVNLSLSRERAVRVAKAFAQRGITGATIAGFGPAIPVADNSTEIGRERNRRVEIWLSR